MSEQDTLLRPDGPSPVPQAPPPSSGPRTHLGIYRIVRLIGRGGMGEVYEGFDEGLHRPVALKVLSAQYNEQTEHVERFLAEGRAVARINHPNVVQVYFAGSMDGTNFLSMELVKGKSLEEVVKEDGCVEPAVSLPYMIDAVQGLHEAREQGIIHRDIKPANLLLSEEEKIVKITDFGLAKVIESEHGMTQTGTIMGTPLFMSPEQGQGNRLDHRTDIYSLGATFFYLLTGQAPFSGANFMAVILAHMKEPVPAINGIPPTVNRLIGKMMAKTPEQRHSGYGELLDEMRSMQQMRVMQNIKVKPTSSMPTIIQQVEPARPTPVPRSVTPAAQEAETLEQETLSSEDRALLDSLEDLLAEGRH